MRRTVVAGLAIALVATLSACAGGPISTTVAPAQVAPTADCLAPQVVADLGLRVDTQASLGPTHPDVPEAGAVPEGFVPVGVLACESGERLTDAAGIWDAVTARRLEGDLEPLLAALAEDADPSPAKQTCTAPPQVTVQLWIVDALGRGVRALVPVDGCGVPRQAVTSALAELEETDVTHFPVHLAAARAASAPSADPAG